MITWSKHKKSKQTCVLAYCETFLCRRWKLAKENRWHRWNRLVCFRNNTYSKEFLCWRMLACKRNKNGSKFWLISSVQKQWWLSISCWFFTIIFSQFFIFRQIVNMIQRVFESKGKKVPAAHANPGPHDALQHAVVGRRRGQWW